MQRLDEAVGLWLEPQREYRKACFVELDDSGPQAAMRRWWRDPSLVNVSRSLPIDLGWRWSDSGVEFRGRRVEVQSLGLQTEDGEIQGALTVSMDSVPSGVGDDAILLERLFAAPRNRPNLRRDGKSYYKGFGHQALAWASRYSRVTGCFGQVRLDACLEAVQFYLRCGMQLLKEAPVMFEGRCYYPMLLPTSAARELLVATPRFR